MIDGWGDSVDEVESMQDCVDDGELVQVGEGQCGVEGSGGGWVGKPPARLRAEAMRRGDDRFGPHPRVMSM